MKLEQSQLQLILNSVEPYESYCSHHSKTTCPSGVPALRYPKEENKVTINKQEGINLCKFSNVSNLLLNRIIHCYASNQRDIPSHTETKIEVRLNHLGKENEKQRHASLIKKTTRHTYLVTQHNSSLVKLSRTEIMGPTKQKERVN